MAQVRIGHSHCLNYKLSCEMTRAFFQQQKIFHFKCLTYFKCIEKKLGFWQPIMVYLPNYCVVVMMLKVLAISLQLYCTARENERCAYSVRVSDSVLSTVLLKSEQCSKRYHYKQ